MYHWSIAKDGTIGEKRLSQLWLFTAISCRAPFVLDFEWRGNINLELPDQ